MYIIEKLKIIRQKICGYADSDNFCDCKYGINDPENHRGEQTGCPEIRDAIHLLEQSYILLKKAQLSVENYALGYEIKQHLEEMEKEY